MSCPNIFVLRQLDRSLNDSHYKNVFIKSTIYDEFSGTRKEYDLLCGMEESRWRGTEVEIAKDYNGENARLGEKRT